MLRTVYVVAVTRSEAEGLAPSTGWDDKGDADRHLKDVKETADPSFAHKVFKVHLDGKDVGRKIINCHKIKKSDSV